MMFVFRSSSKPEESQFREYDHENNYMNKCSLPVYDFWDSKVMRYVDYNYDPAKKCDKTFKPYTELVNGSWGIVEERKGTNCSARCIQGVDDWNLRLSDWMKPGPVNCEFLEAVCWEDDTEVYGYIHTQIIPKQPTTPTTSTDPPSVFVFLFDSMSFGSAKRSFPKTLSLLSSRLDSVEFPFVNKVGENSMPNGFSLWFGKLIEPILGKNYGGVDVEVDWNSTSYCYTHLNGSIFGEFEKQGYMTLNIDDWNAQMVNYPDCEGFKDPPTHHYMHPFYMASEKFGSSITKNHLKGKVMCREARHPAFQYFQDFVNTYKDKPMFTWTWINTAGHDNFNGLMRVDKEMVEIIEKNMEKFENSFFIFMGDHGFRMGMKKFMETAIGGVEVSNPYLSISIPKKLRKDQSILEIMRENSQKLQTHFDTRATLLDILKHQPQTSFTDRSLLEVPGEWGNSYLRHQPEFPRTCGSLPIPPEYCICQIEKTPVTDENLRERFGHMLIDHIHDMLDHSNYTWMCEKYKFRETISFFHYGRANKSDSPHNYEITVMADFPSYAQFRTILTHDKKASHVSFGNIVRLDRYLKTGSCTNSGANMSLKKESPVTILQAIIFIQFGLSFSITILTTIGIAFGYPVASYYLMALLQALVAIPGIVYIALQGNIWIAVYISFQLVTASCEIYWLIYMIFDKQSAGAWLGLACLTFVNIVAVVIAIWFRQSVLKVPCKKNKKIEAKDLDMKSEKPDMKVPSTSMSEVEKSKGASSKAKSTSSIKKSPARSMERSDMSEKSSKGSLKVRKTKKSSSPSMPLDSRETTSLSRSSSKTAD
ncbi:hypothetical protein B9Z55_001651 [Caenorhabditis nigoni]|nr:hypothetical protein B9Z55_001651 [Caenorhabditis nigoni]